MKIFLQILFSVILLLPTIFSDAQESMISTGGDISGNGGSISFSVGQVSFTTHSGINGSVAAGVQQAYEISVFTEADNTNEIILSCSVYPNPTTDFLILQINNYKYEDLKFQLYNISGTLLKTQKIDSGKTTIPMLEYTPATYFLQVSSNQINIKTFKIIKH